MNSRQKHIAICCSRLDLPGGIERAIVNLSNLLVEKELSVTLIILDETAASFYPIDKRIIIIQQPLSFGIGERGNILTRKINWLGDMVKLRKIISKLKPDLLIGTEYPFAIAAILAGAKKYSAVVSWEHHHYFELKKNAFWNKLFNLTYPKLDAVVCLNAAEQKFFGAVNGNSVVIPNFIATVKETSSGINKTILTVARLTAVKGIDLLLPVARLVLNQHPDWIWKIIGNGEMEEQVRQFIKKEKLASQLLLQPPVDHAIADEYQTASLYVMSSRNECFPMVLLEAQATGLPCVCFDCDTGPRHIITDKENGLLVEKENIIQLAAAVSLLINNEAQRKNMGLRAIQNMEHFSPERIYGAWNDLIKTLTSHKVI